MLNPVCALNEELKRLIAQLDHLEAQNERLIELAHLAQRANVVLWDSEKREWFSLGARIAEVLGQELQVGAGEHRRWC
jgi:hypothetical protein